jgi:hypothetical protein
MKHFTVIGYYESSGQTFAHHVLAHYPSGAFTAAAQVGEQEHGPDADDVVFVVALKGHHQEGAELFFPGEGVVDSATVLDQPEVFGE